MGAKRLRMKCPKNNAQRKRKSTPWIRNAPQAERAQNNRQKTEGRVANKRKKERKWKDQGLDKHDRRALKIGKTEKEKKRMGEDGGEEPCSVHLQSG